MANKPSASVMAKESKAIDSMAMATIDEAVHQRSPLNLERLSVVITQPDPSAAFGHVINQRANVVAGSSRTAPTRRKNHSRGRSRGKLATRLRRTDPSQPRRSPSRGKAPKKAVLPELAQPTAQRSWAAIVKSAEKGYSLSYIPPSMIN